MKRLFLPTLVAAAFLAGSLSADVYWDLSFDGQGGKAQSVTIKHWTGALDGAGNKQYRTVGVSAGMFQMRSENSVGPDFPDQHTFYTFCTDVGVWLESPQSYLPVPFDQAGLGIKPPWRDGGIRDAAWLFNNTETVIANANTLNNFTGWSAAESAGMQLAIWKVLYDVPDLTRTDLGLGDTSSNFSASSGDAFTEAVKYIGAMVDAENRIQYDATWLKPQGESQGLLYRPVGFITVPDGGLTVLLLGLSCLGLGLARRKHSS